MRKPKIFNFRFALYLAAAAVLVGLSMSLTECGGGGGSVSLNNPSGGGQLGFEKATPRGEVSFSYSSVVPITNNMNATYTIYLNNNTNKDYQIVSIGIANDEDEKVLDVNSDACAGALNLGGKCTIQINPKISSGNADVVISAKLLNAVTKEPLEVTQIVRMSDKIDSSNANGNFIMNQDISMIITRDGNYSLAIPIILAKNFKSVTVTNGELIGCNGYGHGDSCTWIISGNTQVTGEQAQLVGGSIIATPLDDSAAPQGVVYAVSTDAAPYNIQFGVKSTKQPYILMSYAADIDANSIADDGKTAKITLFNSGAVAAKGIVISIDNDNKDGIDGNANQCQAIEPNETCEVKFKLKDTQLIHYRSIVKVKYGDSENSSLVFYKVPNATFALNLTSPTTFTNMIVGASKIDEIIAKNNGKREIMFSNITGEPLDGVSYGVDSTLNQLTKITNNTKLVPNSKGYYGIRFNPQEALSEKSLTVAFGGLYSMGTKSNVSVKYSALAPDKVLVLEKPNPEDSLPPGNSNGISFDNDGKLNINILGDNKESKVAVFPIKNTSNQDVIIGDMTLDTVTFSELAKNDSNHTCNNLLALNPGKSCNISVKYGPTNKQTAKYFDKDGGGIKLAYTAAGTIKGIITVPVIVKVGEYADVKVEAKVTSDVAGQDSKAYNETTPLVVSDDSARAYITYTITNNGNDDQEIAIGNMISPAAELLTSGSCKITQGTVSVLPGKGNQPDENNRQCTVVLKVPSGRVIETPSFAGGAAGLKGGIVTNPLSVFWRDKDGTAQTVTPGASVHYTREWGGLIGFDRILPGTSAKTTTIDRENQLIMVKYESNLNKSYKGPNNQTNYNGSGWVLDTDINEHARIKGGTVTLFRPSDTSSLSKIYTAPAVAANNMPWVLFPNRHKDGQVDYISCEKIPLTIKISNGNTQYDYVQYIGMIELQPKSPDKYTCRDGQVVLKDAAKP